MSVLVAIQAMRDLMRRAHENAVAKGFWSPKFRITTHTGPEVIFMTPADAVQDPTVLASKIALITSESSEMLEGLRKSGPDQHLPAFSSEEVEWADQLIRLMDYGEARGFNPETVLEKMAYNEDREHMHGKAL